MNARTGRSGCALAVSRRIAPAPLEAAADVPSGALDALAVYAKGELREHVARVLDSIDAEYREVIALRYVSELSWEEVAQALGVSVGAAKMRLARAREVLAYRLKSVVEEHGR